MVLAFDRCPDNIKINKENCHLYRMKKVEHINGKFEEMSCLKVDTLFLNSP